jgi:hypothetical protein
MLADGEKPRSLIVHYGQIWLVASNRMMGKPLEGKFGSSL